MPPGLLIVVLLLTLALGGHLSAAVELVPEFPNAIAGEVLTWDIRGEPPTWHDPDPAKSAHLEIVGPDRQVWKRSAFLYRDYTLAPPLPATAPQPAHALEFLPAGDLALRVRHTARIGGDHAWTLFDPAGTPVASGVIHVAPATGPTGPLGVDPDNHRLLAYADGTVFVPVGPNLAWADGPDRLGTFTRWFADLKAVGANHCRIWMASWCGQVDGDRPGAWRLDQAWLFDGILRAAHAAGLKVTVVLDNAHDIQEGHAGPYGAVLDERLAKFLAPDPAAAWKERIRYIMARWGCDDTIMAWELCNELDMAQPIRERALPWIAPAAAALRAADADNRLRTVSWSGDDWYRAMKVDGIDIAQIHTYVLEWADPDGFHKATTRDGVGMLLDPAATANSLDQPWFFGELGYQGSNNDHPGLDLDGDGMLLRQQAWAGFLLGGCGSGMTWWWDVYLDHRNLWAQYRGLSRTINRIDWKQAADFHPFQPNLGDKVVVLGWQGSTQALLWCQPRADTWYSALIEKKPRTSPPLYQIVRSGFEPNIDLTAHYVDMATGDERAHLNVKSDAKGQAPILVPSRGLDLVIFLEKKP